MTGLPDQPITYLDHAATTPVRPEVREAMDPFASEIFANASAAYGPARRARHMVEEAREVVAACLGARPAEVVFTSGGTESDNLAVLGVLAVRSRTSTVVGAVCSAIEHAAVLEPLRAAARGDALFGLGTVRLREVGVTKNGVLDLVQLAESLSQDTALVSVMAANNEVGTIQPLREVCSLVRRLAPTAFVHTDAVQAAPYLDLASVAGGCDLVSISAHKLGGPKGVGALVVREPARVAPMLRGGGQEHERRASTLNVGGIVGLAAALGAAVAERCAQGQRIRGLRDRLADSVCSAVADTVESVPRDITLPGHCHLRFAGVDREELLVLLDQAGVCASAGSACASGAVEPSHVLLAMGVTPAAARTGVRFTLGSTTTSADVDRAVSAVTDAVAKLRG